MRNKDRNERVFQYTGDPLSLNDLNAFVKKKIGNLCFVSSIPDSTDDFVGIGIIREEITVDDLTGKIRIRLHDYSDVFKAYFFDGDFGLQLVFPSSSDVHDQFITKLDNRTISSEECVMESMGSKLLGIPMVRTQMNPLFELLNYVVFNGSLELTERFPGLKVEKIRDYSQFLADMDLLTIENNSLYPGKDTYPFRDNWGPNSAIESISSKIGHKELMILHSDFSFQNMLPFIRMSNINCLSSYYDDKPQKWTPAMFERSMTDYYRNSPIGTMNTLTRAYDLVNADIFNSDRIGSKMVFSCEPIYEDYSSLLKRTAIAFA